MRTIQSLSPTECTIHDLIERSMPAGTTSSKGDEPQTSPTLVRWYGIEEICGDEDCICGDEK